MRARVGHELNAGEFDELPCSRRCLPPRPVAGDLGHGADRFRTHADTRIISRHMGRTDPTESQLLAMVEHIAYDMNEVRAQYLAIAIEGGPTGSARNAAVLAFLIHARNLLAFYWPPPRRDQREGDVFAYDFVPGLQIAPPDKDESLSELRKAISTRVAHICLLRAEKLQWVANVILDSLNRGRSEFLRDLTEPYRTEFAKHGIAYGQSQ